MTARFSVTITTAEELRLLEEHDRLMQLQSPITTAVFDDSETIRAHGLGVGLDERE